MSVRKIAREDAAEISGLSARHLLRLHESDDPPPWVGDGYECKAFGRWLARRRDRERGMGDDGQVYDYERERARLTKAQADRTELEAAELRGEMVRAEHVIEAWARMVGAARARLLSLPTKAGPRARAASNDEEAASVIEAEIIEALEELSSDGLPDRTRARRTRHEASPETSAAPDSEPVGGRIPAPESGKRRRTRKVED